MSDLTDSVPIAGGDQPSPTATGTHGALPDDTMIFTPFERCGVSYICSLGVHGDPTADPWEINHLKWEIHIAHNAPKEQLNEVTSLLSQIGQQYHRLVGSFRTNLTERKYNVPSALSKTLPKQHKKEFTKGYSPYFSSHDGGNSIVATISHVVFNKPQVRGVVKSMSQAPIYYWAFEE